MKDKYILLGIGEVASSGLNKVDWGIVLQHLNPSQRERYDALVDEVLADEIKMYGGPMNAESERFFRETLVPKIPGGAETIARALGEEDLYESLRSSGREEAR